MTLDTIATGVGVAGVALALWSVVRTLRAGRVGADVVALLAVVGALVVGEQVAAALITCMLASGMWLDARANARADRSLRELVDRQPRIARRRTPGGIETVEVGALEPGDVVVVAAGGALPVDGQLLTRAVVDESALTGEPLPRDVAAGEVVAAGAVNAGPPLELRATATASASAYAEIVRLAAEASARSAPMVRLADRMALVLLGLGLVTAAGAWIATGELARAVAVLVVATPCPLVLAVPIAITSGMSRAARRGVVVKGGAVLERLGRATVLLLDKTGTLTVGRPEVVSVLAVRAGDEAEVLALAASIDQVSSHVIAEGIVRAAVARGSAPREAHDVGEEAGRGTSGTVSGRRVRVGRASWLGVADDDPLVVRAREVAAGCDGTVVLVEADGAPLGAIVLADRIRPDAPRTLRRLRALGIRRIVMVTGDRPEPAEAIARLVGADDVLAARHPGDKLRDVAAEQGGGRDVVVMVGDGINDAPALAAADVGVAMGARGGTGSTEAADVVIGTDRLDRLADAMEAAGSARRIALQSAAVGVALSIVAMAVAAAGFLPAAWGALVQEAIDVAVILNALRALVDRTTAPRLDGPGAAVAHRFVEQHELLRPRLDRLLALADAVGAVPGPAGIAPARRALDLLRDEFVPHEAAEDDLLYPVVATALGGSDPTAVMSRGHVEIARLVARLDDVLAHVGEAATPAEVNELRRLLYGLHAVLVLHTSQEDEGYLSLADPPPGPNVSAASSTSDRAGAS